MVRGLRVVGRLWGLVRGLWRLELVRVSVDNVLADLLGQHQLHLGTLGLAYLHLAGLDGVGVIDDPGTRVLLCHVR